MSLLPPSETPCTGPCSQRVRAVRCAVIPQEERQKVATEGRTVQQVADPLILQYTDT